MPFRKNSSVSADILQISHHNNATENGEFLQHQVGGEASGDRDGPLSLSKITQEFSFGGRANDVNKSKAQQLR